MREVFLTYTNPRGKSATFHTQKQGGQHPPYLLNGITGVGGVDPEYESIPLTGSNGSALGPSRYPSRIIQTTCMVYGATDTERDANMRRLLGILDTRQGDGTITYRNHEKTFYTPARAKILPSFGVGTLIGNWKGILIDYECAYPFFMGNEVFSALVAESSASFKLPFKVPFMLGITKYRAQAVNDSDIEVPARIVIYGPSEKPVVTNTTTGATMRIRKSIGIGEKLTIVTGPRLNVSISQIDGDEANAINYVDLVTSQWLTLAPGPNELVYTNNNAVKNTRIEVFWSDWYLGVG